MTEAPRVTAAVLAYDRREELATTLRLLRDELEYPAGRLDIVVVDNASADGTAAMVRRDFPEVELIELPENVGVAGWNAAFARARGEYVLVLDDDCALTGDGLERAVRAAREQDADLVSFFVASPGEDADFSTEFATGLLSFWGCAALIRTHALERLGGFDPAIFLWAHELDFTMRLLDAGLTHLHLPEV